MKRFLEILGIFAILALVLLGYFAWTRSADAATLHDYGFSDFAQTYSVNLDMSAGDNLVCIVQTNDSSDSITGINDGEASISPTAKNQETVGNSGWKYLFESPISSTQTSITVVKTGTPTIAIGCESIAGGFGVDTYDFKDVNASSFQMNTTTTDANDFVIGLLRAYSTPADVINGYPRANNGGDIALVDSNGSSTTPGGQFTLGIGNAEDQYSGTIVSIRGESGAPVVATDTVSIIAPADGANLNQFKNWWVGYTLANSPAFPNAYFLNIKYGLTTSTMVSLAAFQSSLYGIIGNNTTYLPNYGQFNASTTYYAQANLYFRASSSLATTSITQSQIISFTLNNSLIITEFGTTSSVPVPVPTQQYSNAVAETCPSADIFASSAVDTVSCWVRVGVQRFVSSTAAALNDTINGIAFAAEHTFPVNVFVHLDSDLASSSPPAAASTSIVLTGAGNIFGGRSFTIITTSSISAVLLDKVGFDYRTLLDYILYAMTGLTVIAYSASTFRHITSAKKGAITKK